MDANIDLTEHRYFREHTRIPSSSTINISNETSILNRHFLEWVTISNIKIKSPRKYINAFGKSLSIENEDLREVPQYECPRCGRKVCNQYDLCDYCRTDILSYELMDKLFKEKDLVSLF